MRVKKEERGLMQQLGNKAPTQRSIKACNPNESRLAAVARRDDADIEDSESSSLLVVRC